MCVAHFSWKKKKKKRWTVFFLLGLMLKLLNGPVTFFLLLFSPLSLFRHVFLLLEKNVDNEMQKIRIKDRLVVTRNTNKFWLRISKTSDYLLLDISFWLSL